MISIWLWCVLLVVSWAVIFYAGSYRTGVLPLELHGFGDPLVNYVGFRIVRNGVVYKVCKRPWWMGKAKPGTATVKLDPNYLPKYARHPY